MSEHLCIEVKRLHKPKVAIIGGGMSGCATAYWLSLISKGSIQLTIFESSGLLGGRARLFQFDGRSYEVGASIIHESNSFAVNFCKLFNLSTRPCFNKRFRCLVMKNKQIIFSESGSDLRDTLTILWRYPLTAILNFQNQVNNALHQFRNIYSLLSAGISFSRPQDLIASVIPDPSCLDSPIRPGNLFAETFGAAAARCNYNQGDLPAFPFLVSGAGSQSQKLFSVKNGNCKISENLARSADAKIKGLKVTEIKSENSKFLIGADRFDAVVIAHPLEISEINFNGKSITRKGEFQKTNVLLVKGVLRQRFRGYSAIFSCDAAEGWSSVGLLTPTDATEAEADEVVTSALAGKSSVWKVFSETPLTDELIREIFESAESKSESLEWLAYPKYKSSTFYPFVLEPGLFATCAIERAASAIEMALISGKNVALLVREFLLLKFNQ